jgi:hypothetical protein
MPGGRKQGGTNGFCQILNRWKAIRAFKTCSEKKENIIIPKGMVSIIKGTVWIFGLIFIFDRGFLCIAQVFM